MKPRGREGTERRLQVARICRAQGEEERRHSGSQQVSGPGEGAPHPHPFTPAPPQTPILNPSPPPPHPQPLLSPPSSPLHPHPHPPPPQSLTLPLPLHSRPGISLSPLPHLTPLHPHDHLHPLILILTLPPCTSALNRLGFLPRGSLTTALVWPLLASLCL